MKEIHWGFIGCGEVTEKKSGPAFNQIAGSKIVAVMSRSGDKVDLSNGMSVTARVEYDQVTYFEYAMEALGVLFR